MGDKDSKKRNRSRSRERSKKDKHSKRSRSRSRDKKSKKYRDYDRDKDRKQRKKSRSRSMSEDEKQKYRDKIKNFEERTQNENIKQKIIQQELGYTNEDNPFGDKNLHQQFQWKKKQKEQQKEMENNQNQEQGGMKLSKEEQMQLEIEQVKKQRQAREIEKQKMEEEKNRAQKEKDDEQFQLWMEKENQFQKEQIKIRALVRMNFTQEKPIDTLVKICYCYRGKIAYEKRFAVVMENMEDFLKHQNSDSLHEIVQEAKAQFLNNQEQKTNFENYWESIITLGENIQENKIEEGNTKEVRKNVISQEFIDEVKDLYEGKSYEELVEFEKEIEQTLQGNEFDVMDYEYWENIMKCLKIYKAKVVLIEMYNKFKIEFKDFDINKQENQALQQGNADEQEKFIQEQFNKKTKEEEEEQKFLQQGSLSPQPHEYSEQFLKKLKVYKQEEVTQEINQLRQTIFDKEFNQAMQQIQQFQQQQQKEKQDAIANLESQQETDRQFQERNNQMYADGLDSYTQQMIARCKNQPLEEGEEEFNETINVENKKIQNSNSILKRPQYFNRIKMGYEWNKYNQVHFDTDNPPPRVVQGYKFNIFYPELMDSTISPDYHLEECPDSPDFFLLRFSAGPPYEDIAFKIIKKEWDLMDKKGFKCVFSKGILHLYFNFKRNRYRR